MGENINRSARHERDWIDTIVLDVLKEVGEGGFSVSELLSWLIEDGMVSFVLTKRNVTVALMRLAREGRVERVAVERRGAREPRWRLTKKEQKLMSIVRVSKRGFRSADKSEAGGMTKKARAARDELVARLIEEGDGGAHLFEVRRATDSVAPGAWMLSWHGPVGQFGLYLIYPEGQVR